ncbi:MAG: PD-(D/E)XK nuclease family protein, partial [Planctomycetia bacterium]
PPTDATMVTAAREQAENRAHSIRMPTFTTVTPRDFLTEPAERIHHTGRGLGQEWGTVIHRLLELAVLQLEKPEATFDLRSAAESIIEESDLAESGIARQTLMERAIGLVEEIRRSTAWQRISRSRERYVEVPFTIAIRGDEIPDGVAVDMGPGQSQSAGADLMASAAAAGTSLPVLVRGQIDAVFEEAAATPDESGWIILDWKTTSVADRDVGKLTDHYRPQLRLYARCWAAGRNSHRPFLAAVPRGDRGR